MIRTTSHVVRRQLGLLADGLPTSSRGRMPGTGLGPQSTAQALQKNSRSNLSVRLSLSRRTYIGAGARHGFSATKQSPSMRFRRGFRFSTRRSAERGTAGAEKEPQSLSARLRKLSREYGWAAVGVYLGFTVIDLPLCFLLVRTVGTENVGMFYCPCFCPAGAILIAGKSLMRGVERSSQGRALRCVWRDKNNTRIDTHKVQRVLALCQTG